jgi:hypothetical protein
MKAENTFSTLLHYIMMSKAMEYLDGDDIVLRAGPFPLRTAQLSEGSFDGNVIIVRPK